MSLFGRKYEHDPVVINMSQKLKFSKNHHAGIFHDSHDVGDEVPREVVEFYPKDAIDDKEANRLCRPNVRRDRIVAFPPGTIAPRAVFWLMPDQPEQLPKQVKSDPQFGPFFQGWYRHKEVISALEYKARTESEIMDKLRFATTPTELDDRAARVFNNYLDQVQDHAKSMNSSSSDDSN